jgi:hypothetical protein
MRNRKFKFVYMIVPLILLVSCSTRQPYDLKLQGEINKRVDILGKSYKFSVIPANLQGHNFSNLKLQIDKILKPTSKDLLRSNYETLSIIFKRYDISLDRFSNEKDELLFSILTGLDNLIFKYIPSRFNFSNYKTIVVPNKTEIKSGDEFQARIYLTVSDSLYEPEIRYFDMDSTGQIRNIYNLASVSGIGEYNLLTHKKGMKKLNGQVIYSNEFGFKDTINWNYKLEIK